MKKKDILLIFILLLTAGAVRLAFAFPRPAGEGTLYAAAVIDGKEAGRWPLGENTEVDIDTSFGHNRIRIRDGAAVMTEADCPDGYCKKQHAIGKNGGSIICLPHHLVIEIRTESGEKADSGVDAVAE